MVEIMEMLLEVYAYSVSSFEVDEKAALWGMTAVMEEAPDEQAITRHVQKALQAMQLEMPVLHFAKEKTQDWVAATAAHFPPLTMGRVYIYGSHTNTPPPAASVSILLDAGAAFGTGEHATTKGCVLALQWLAKQKRHVRVADIGTGTGVLAMAAAKLWPSARMIASDIDVVATAVARDNIRRNNVHTQITTLTCSGVQARAIKRRAPFDCVVANILCRPLVRMAPSLTCIADPRGTIILSGLLCEQERQILAAYRMQGWYLHKRFRLDGWGTLVLRK